MHKTLKRISKTNRLFHLIRHVIFQWLPKEISSLHRLIPNLFISFHSTLDKKCITYSSASVSRLIICIFQLFLSYIHFYDVNLINFHEIRSLQKKLKWKKSWRICEKYFFYVVERHKWENLLIFFWFFLLMIYRWRINL